MTFPSINRSYSVKGVPDDTYRCAIAMGMRRSIDRSSKQARKDGWKSSFRQCTHERELLLLLGRYLDDMIKREERGKEKGREWEERKGKGRKVDEWTGEWLGWCG